MNYSGRTSVVSGWQALLLVFSLGVTVYANSWRGEFHLDDHYNIRENVFVHDLGHALRYFYDADTTSSLPENAPYRPMSTLSFAGLWSLADGATWPFHLFKTLAHCFNAWLCFLIARELLWRSKVHPLSMQLKWFSGRNVPIDGSVIGLLGAALFVVHPALSEAVNYISALTSVQCALFYLVAFYSFLHRRLWLMSIFFVLSMLTKEEGVTLPLTILLYQLIFERRTFKVINRFLVMAASLLVVYLIVRWQFGSATVVFGGIDRHLYLFTQFRAWVFYLYKIFVPVNFSVEHQDFLFSQSFWEWQVVGSLALIMAITMPLLRWTLASKDATTVSVLSYAWLWYLVCLLPSSSVFPLFEPIFEHRYYLSFAVLLPGIAFAALKLCSKVRFLKTNPTLLTSLTAVAMALLAILTIRENIVWRHEKSLWQRVVNLDPHNARALNNLAVAHLKDGRTAEALDLFVRAEVVAPGYKYALIGQMDSLILLGRKNEAKAVVEKLVNSSDGVDTAIVHYMHAKYLIETERQPARALEVLVRCQQVANGKSAGCLRLEMMARRDLGDVAGLNVAGKRAIGVYPDDRTLAFQYGLALIFLNAYVDAQAVFTLIHARDHDIQSLQNIAWIAYKLGDTDLARASWQKKLRLQPGDAPALEGLALLRLIEAPAKPD